MFLFLLSWFGLFFDDDCKLSCICSGVALMYWPPAVTEHIMPVVKKSAQSFPWKSKVVAWGFHGRCGICFSRDDCQRWENHERSRSLIDLWSDDNSIWMKTRVNVQTCPKTFYYHGIFWYFPVNKKRADSKNYYHKNVPWEKHGSRTMRITNSLILSFRF